jgi:hypothetical protein
MERLDMNWRNVCDILTVFFSAVAGGAHYLQPAPQNIWAAVVPTTSQQNNNYVFPEWGMFQPSPYLEGGTRVRVNVTFTGISPSSNIGSVPPEACFFSASAYQHRDITPNIQYL